MWYIQYSAGSQSVCLRALQENIQIIIHRIRVEIPGKDFKKMVEKEAPGILIPT
jgi:hypothetical protein